MSIYRKFATDAPNEVHSSAVVRRANADTLRSDINAAREELERSRRSKAEPSNIALPRTLAWAAGLPPDVQPHELTRLFGRIANMLAADWNEPKLIRADFDQLLVDRRGNRKGFPPKVLAELIALQTYYVVKHPLSSGTWDGVLKR
jgi:hypothetical protein